MPKVTIKAQTPPNSALEAQLSAELTTPVESPSDVPTPTFNTYQPKESDLVQIQFTKVTAAPQIGNYKTSNHGKSMFKVGDQIAVPRNVARVLTAINRVAVAVV